MFTAREEIKNIFWDFDGVLMDSMPIRDKGFEIVLADHPKAEVEQLMKFHRENGGLSRYVKFRYFFEEIKKMKIADAEVQDFAKSFSEVMLQNLIDHELLILDTMEFVKKNHKRYRMHVVSGSDQEELRQICGKLGIDRYFKSLHGSPKPKKKLVEELLHNQTYETSETLMIGDSINDYEAAIENGISFYGYNNIILKKTTNNYIEKFS